MVLRKNLLILGLISIVFFSLLLFIPSSYPSNSLKNTNWDGTSNFGIFLKNKNNYHYIERITSSVSVVIPRIDEKNSIIIIPGARKPYIQEEINSLLSFVVKGGTLIVFENFGFSNTISTAFGLEIDPYPLIDTLNYDSNPYLPIVNTPDYQLALNSPSSVSLSDNFYNNFLNIDKNENLLLKTSNQSFLDINRNLKFDEALEGPALSHNIALKIQFGAGSLTHFTDSQIITNDMLNRRDNLAFLENYLETLNIVNKQIYFDESKAFWLPFGTEGLYNFLFYWIIQFFLHSFQLFTLFTGLTLLFILVNYRSFYLGVFLKKRRKKSPKSPKSLEYLPTIDEEEITSHILTLNYDQEKFDAILENRKVIDETQYKHFLESKKFQRRKKSKIW